jgi:hypothetical protein
MNLNYREENVDRFLEIIATAQKFKIYFNFNLVNAPEGYAGFTHDLGLDWLGTTSNNDFVVMCSRCIPLNKILKPSEPTQDIKNRVGRYNYIKTEKLDAACETLIKNAAEKLSFTTDNVINVIRLAEVIASMENSTLKAEHIAEACQYVKP